MKGDCDRRELAAGAPVSVGGGGMSGHSREGTTGRLETGVKGEHQDSVARSLQVPAVVGGAQGNGTRGFGVAELTRMDEMTPTKGNLQIPSVKSGAIGSIRVPLYKGEVQERGLGREGEAGMQEGSEARDTDGLKIPSLDRETWDLSCSVGLKKAIHDITSGSLSAMGVKAQDQAGATKKGESHSITPGITSPDTEMNGKRTSQTSGAEVPGSTPTKRLSQDSVGQEVPSEASMKRLRTEGTSQTIYEADSQKVSDSHDTHKMAATKRLSPDRGAGLYGVADVKRVRQDSETEAPGLTVLPGASQDSMSDTVNSAPIKAVSHSATTMTGCAGSLKMESQESVLMMSDPACVQTVNQGLATEDLSMESVKGGELDGAMKPAEAALKGSCEGNCVKSPESAAVMQDKIDTAALKIPCVQPGSLTHPEGSPPVPAMKKETDDTSDREKESLGQDGQDDDIDKGKPAVTQQCSEDSEVKQGDAMKDDEKTISRVRLGEAGEGQAEAGSLPKPTLTKPEMVSIETQCDDTSMPADLSLKDEYAFLAEDAGVPGECLGGCEPGRKPHKCCQCDTSFRTPYELSRHARVHSGERPYQCRLCHRCFKRKDHVEVHTRRHVEDRRHACNECGVCFVTSSCLLRHQRRTHQAPGTKRPGDGENGEGEGETTDMKGDLKDQPVSKDAQKNGRRSKKNKPDSTYRPGGKTVCIIKKRNLRQRSYSFVELEDDVECFESDEEDRIPFLKVQEQRREEEHVESNSQSGQLDHSLFPDSLFNPEASLGQLLLMGEVSRLLSHSLLPGVPEGPGTPPITASQVSQTCGPVPDPDWDSDDSDCDPPLVACDVTFMEAEGEVAIIDAPAAPQPEEEVEHDKAVCRSGPLQAATKAVPHSRSCHLVPGMGEVQGTITPPLPPAKGEAATTPPPGSKQPFTPHAPCRPPPTPDANNKLGGTGVGAMGVPRTAWVVPAANNQAKGKNTCDACRRRNEANRLAQMGREHQDVLITHVASKVKEECETRDSSERCQPVDVANPTLHHPMPQTMAQPMTQPTEKHMTQPKVDNKAQSTAQPKVENKAQSTVQPTARPVVVTPPVKPPGPKQRPNTIKRGRKSVNPKKRQSNRTSTESSGAMAVPQRPYKCHLCHFSFRSATELKRHASTHSGERPFLCELCGAGFMRKCHLQLHVRRHSGERRHACPECRMRFFTPSDLARHQAIHETGDKPLECHLCHLTFRRAFHLERHIRRHNEAAPFACKLCGAFFSSAAALRSHDKHHRTPGPHACPDCTAAFTTATALSRHRRVHSARHHRLLRAIERHATAKSSYECVSSEDSPLSLVIRKVSATAAMPGEVGTRTSRDAPDESRGLTDKDKREAQMDNITSGLANTDKKMEGKVEGKQTDTSNTSNETKTKAKESEEVASNPTAPDKTKEGKENITSTPSIIDEIKGNKERITCSPTSVGLGKGGSASKINEQHGKLTSTPSDRETRKRSEKMSSILSVAQRLKERKMGREGKISAVLLPGNEAGMKGEVNSSRHGEKSAIVQENSDVFGFCATDGRDSIGPINLSISGSSRPGKEALNHREVPVFPGLNSGSESGNKVVSMEAGNVEGTASKTTTTTTTAKREIRVVSTEELNSKASLGLSHLGTERQEAQARSSCGVLLPTSREPGSVQEELHCCTTYHLAAPSGGQEAVLQPEPGYLSGQESGRGSVEDGGQQGSAREGVTTTS